MKAANGTFHKGNSTDKTLSIVKIENGGNEIKLVLIIFVYLFKMNDQFDKSYSIIL